MTLGSVIVYQLLDFGGLPRRRSLLRRERGVTDETLKGVVEVAQRLAFVGCVEAPHLGLKILSPFMRPLDDRSVDAVAGHYSRATVLPWYETSPPPAGNSGWVKLSDVMPTHPVGDWIVAEINHAVGKALFSIDRLLPLLREEEERTNARLKLMMENIGSNFGVPVSLHNTADTLAFMMVLDSQVFRTNYDNIDHRLRARLKQSDPLHLDSPRSESQEPAVASASRILEDLAPAQDSQMNFLADLMVMIRPKYFNEASMKRIATEGVAAGLELEWMEKIYELLRQKDNPEAPSFKALLASTSISDESHPAPERPATE